MSEAAQRRYSVAVDFDGVLHSYTSGWKGPTSIPDAPVEGAIAWLNEVGEEYDVVVFTTRAVHPGGALAVSEWLAENGVTCSFGVTAEKPLAVIYVDDRAWRFRGHFPTMKTIRHSKPWRTGDPATPVGVKIRSLKDTIHHLEGCQKRLRGDLRNERARGDAIHEALHATTGLGSCEFCAGPEE